MRDSNYEPEHYRCSNCKFYHNGCKRVDGKTIKFAKPWFKCDYDCSAVCCDFELKDYMKYAKANWVNFDTYWEEYVENWLPYKNENILVYFELHNDESVRYGVRLKDYVFGNMYTADGKLNAVEKEYYRKTRKGFGLKLIHEPIDGVYVNETAV